MKTNILKYATILMAIIVTACSTDITADKRKIVVPTENGKLMKIYFDVNLTTFKGEGTTRSADWTWKNGDVVYIQYCNKGSRVYGHATYVDESKNWTPSYANNLQDTEEDTCEVYFFDGGSIDGNSSSVKFNKTNAIYADKKGIYRIKDNEIHISAILKPFTSRVRFVSKNNSVNSITIEGLKFYTAYDYKNNQLIDSIRPIHGVVTSGTTLPYYCVLANADSILTISNDEDGDDTQFVKSFKYEDYKKPDVLKVGESGYITIPTKKYYPGWDDRTTEQEFEVKGVKFKMKLVKGGTFKMGSNIKDDKDETPVHDVTLSDYWMGETEVTQALWLAVMDNKPETDGNGKKWGEDVETSWGTTIKTGKGPNYPAYYINYDDCKIFMEKLNNKLGTSFRLPTEAEWEFAAKGGRKCIGYHDFLYTMYAGSDSIGKVAWYYGNSNDGTTMHEVKGRNPNELGLFDMSGNVYEWCADWYGEYHDSNQIDPTGPNEGDKRVSRGGCFTAADYKCTCTNRSKEDPLAKDYFLGVRLALDAK